MKTLRSGLAVCLVLWATGVGCATTQGGLRGGAAKAGATAAPTLEGFSRPADDILSGGRITAADVEALHAAGVRHVIDLGVDAETPDFDEAAAVRAAGMRYDNLPIRGAAGLDADNVLAFDRLLDGIDGPALVHCASGNRVGALVALRAAWLEGADVEAAVEEGRRWGLRGLETDVRERLAREPCLAGAQDVDVRCAAVSSGHPARRADSQSSAPAGR